MFNKWLYKLVAFLLIGKIKVYGKLPEIESYLVVSNHPSVKDIFAFHVLTEKPIKILAHNFFKNFPLFSKLMGLELVSIKKGVELLENGEIVFCCAEGWLSSTGELKEFKTGGAVMAMLSGCQVVPITLTYSNYPGSWILEYGIKTQIALAFLLNFLYRKGVTVVIHEPVKFAGDVKSFTGYIRYVIFMVDLK